MKSVVLASTSPRRAQLLEQIGVPFTVVAPRYEEDMTMELPVHELASVLAVGKARSITDMVDADAVIVAADTFIEFDGRLLGKPRDIDDARSMLRRLQGNMNVVHTGWAVIDSSTTDIAIGVASSKVMMYELTESDIDGYIATGEPLDKAGSYAINGRAGAFIESIEGDPSAIVGLPLGAVARALHRFGIPTTAATAGMGESR